MKTIYLTCIISLLLVASQSCEKTEKPEIYFSADKNSISVGTTINFIDMSKNQPTKWEWDFGDGHTSNKQNPSHTYTTIGSYTVSLTISNKKGTDAETKNNFISVNPENVTDYDGNEYKTVQLGDQIWMATNLKTIHYSDGSKIPQVTNDTFWWAYHMGNKAAWCYPEDDSLNKAKYGLLYTRKAAMRGDTGSKTNPYRVQGICPDGWHLPSDDEWKELEKYFGMNQSDADTTGWRGQDEGKSVKSKLKVNFAGFHGALSYNGYNYYGLESLAYYWTSTPEKSGYSYYYRKLNSDKQKIYRDYNYDSDGYASVNGYTDKEGFSVRCIKD